MDTETDQSINQSINQSILKSSISALQRKNPAIKEDEDLGNHDAWHAIAHPAFSEQNIGKDMPVIGTRIINELNVLATQVMASNFVSLYNNAGEFIDIVPRNSNNNYYARRGKVSEDPITFEQLKNYLTQIYYLLTETTSNKVVGDNMLPTEDQSNALPVSDQAIAYYMTRGELIREKLKEAGYNNIGYRSDIDAIPTELFVVPKDAVIAALEAKYGIDREKGERFSIKTEIPSNRVEPTELEHSRSTGLQATGHVL